MSVLVTLLVKPDGSARLSAHEAGTTPGGSADEEIAAQVVRDDWLAADGTLRAIRKALLDTIRADGRFGAGALLDQVVAAMRKESRQEGPREEMMSDGSAPE